MSDVPTRDRLVYAAMELFGAKGFGATSVAEILAAANANSGSLYNLFPTKQALLEAVLDAYYAGIDSMLLAPAWEGVDDPIERIFALLAAYRRLLVDSDCLYGCPIGSIALELHEPDPAVRERLAANFTQWAARVEACLIAAGDRLPATCDRRALSRLVLSVMEGGVMQARTHRTLEAFDDGVALLRDYLRRLERDAKEGRGP